MGQLSAFMIDGVFNVTHKDQAVVIPVGTVGRNQSFHYIAFAIASGETEWTIRQVLDSVKKAVQLLFPAEDGVCNYYLILDLQYLRELKNISSQTESKQKRSISPKRISSTTKFWRSYLLLNKAFAQSI